MRRFSAEPPERDTRGSSMTTPAQKMAAEQLAPHGVTDERVLRVMSEIPREEFISPRLRRFAYDGRALGIQWGPTISQPLAGALVTPALPARPAAGALGGGA